MSRVEKNRLEWIVFGLGLVLVLGTVGFLAWDALNGTDSPPDLTANVPAPIKAALKLFLSDLYENRGQTVLGQTAIKMPWAAEALLAPFRIYSH